MKSMTGYAKRQVTIGDRNVTIEIKTLNGKQMDIAVKMPSTYRSRELDVRSMLAPLERGKIDVIITEDCSNAAEGQMDVTLIESRFVAIKELAARMGLCVSDDVAMQSVLQGGDVWQQSAEEELTDVEWKKVSDGIRAAVEEVDAFRQHEGSVMGADIAHHVDVIEAMLCKIPPYEEERMRMVRERLTTALLESGIHVDNERFEQELIYYLEKLDITEEKVRLAKHIAYFRDVMTNEPTCGKKLAFVAQEMGREINTTGSKANHVEIQRLVVVMKDELEKIKEQLGNIL